MLVGGHDVFNLLKGDVVRLAPLVLKLSSADT